MPTGAKTELFVRQIPGGMFIVNNESFTTGDIYFVDSVTGTNSVGNGRNPDFPVATIAYALANLVTANKGDRVYVFPNHTETLTAAATVAQNVAGVSVIGIGAGRQRPVVNYTTAAAASWDVSAAKCVIQNLVFTPTGVAAVTAGINVTAADVQILNCEFDFANATNQAALAILTNASASRLAVRNCDFHGTANAGTAAAIRLVGGSDIRITDNFIRGSFTTTKGGIDNITTAITNLLVARNVIINDTALSTVCVNCHASTTGAIVDNRMGILSGTAPIVAAGIDLVSGNYFKGAVGVAAGTLI